MQKDQIKQIFKEAQTYYKIREMLIVSGCRDESMDDQIVAQIVEHIEDCLEKLEEQIDNL